MKPQIAQIKQIFLFCVVIVNSHSQLNIVFRISNAYTQYGQIANPAEQSALSEECGRYEKGNNEI